MNNYKREDILRYREYLKNKNHPADENAFLSFLNLGNLLKKDKMDMDGFISWEEESFRYF